MDKTDGNMTNPMNSTGRVTSLVRTFKKPASEEYWLSIGKIFHKLSLTGQVRRVEKVVFYSYWTNSIKFPFIIINTYFYSKNQKTVEWKKKLKQ